MNFYFSLYQLIETVESLGRNVQHLASRALRISPRDARANRELLEQCESKINEVKVLLNNKTHISKITLRKAAILFTVLDLFYRRLMALTAATSSVGQDDENSVKALWQLLASAQKHYQTIVKTLFDLTGIPVTLMVTGHLNGQAEPTTFPELLQKEISLQQESLKQLEKAIEVFGEEQELADKLSGIRKDLLDMKKRFKQYVAPVSSEKIESIPLPPTLSKN
jgi:hypothetical protein